MKIKTGQTVKVLSGKDKGKTGKVIQVFPKLDKVVIDGVNKMYKHLKRSHRSSQSGQTSQSGERVEYFGPIHVSNVKVVEDVGEEKKESVEKKNPTKNAKSG